MEDLTKAPKHVVGGFVDSFTWKAIGATLAIVILIGVLMWIGIGPDRVQRELDTRVQDRRVKRAA